MPDRLPARLYDPDTGETEIIPAPCGATLASKCPPCAERARKLRMAQCAAGWHLDDEPVPDPDPPTDDQRALMALRADYEAARAEAETEADAGQVADLDDAISEVVVCRTNWCGAASPVLVCLGVHLCGNPAAISPGRAD